MAEFPTIRQVVLDTADVRGLAEFYRRMFGLTYRPGDEPPAPGEPGHRVRRPGHPGPLGRPRGADTGLRGSFGTSVLHLRGPLARASVIATPQSSGTHQAHGLRHETCAAMVTAVVASAVTASRPRGAATISDTASGGHR